MEKLTDIKSAIVLFKEASVNHAKSIEEGNYKNANRNYDNVIKSVSYLKKEDAVYELLILLTSNDIAIRLSAATFLLPTHEQESKKTLIDIMKNQDIHSFRAEMILKEWQKGNLNI